MIDRVNQSRKVEIVDPYINRLSVTKIEIKSARITLRKSSG